MGIRLQNPIYPKTNRCQDEPEAVCPEQLGTQGTTGLGLDSEPPEGRVQLGLRPDDQRLLGAGGGDGVRGRQLGTGAGDDPLTLGL